MRKFVFFLILTVFVLGCGSGLEKHAAGLVLAEHLNAKLLMEIDFWNDGNESRGYFIVCGEERKVLFVTASFRNGRVVRVPIIKVIEGASCAVLIKSN